MPVTFFKCDYGFCRFFRNCPKNHQVSATLHSNPDEMGMPLYFGQCEEIGRTFTEVSYDRVTIVDECAESTVPRSDIAPVMRIAEEDKKEILEAIREPKSVSGFTEEGTNELIVNVKKVFRKKRDVKVSSIKLTQVQVAKDFGVDRQTIIRWESAQTEDGPNNKSNEWGYYKGLRTNPDLRDAYYKLVNMVAKYNEYKKACQEAGKPLYTFYQYNEAWAKHNKKYGGA